MKIASEQYIGYGLPVKSCDGEQTIHGLCEFIWRVKRENSDKVMICWNLAELELDVLLSGYLKRFKDSVREAIKRGSYKLADVPVYVAGLTEPVALGALTATEALNNFTTALKLRDDPCSVELSGTQFFNRHSGMSFALPDESSSVARISELERQLAERAATIRDQANQIFSLQIELANHKALLTAAVPAVEKPADPLARALACTGRKPVIGLRTP